MACARRSGHAAGGGGCLTAACLLPRMQAQRLGGSHHAPPLPPRADSPRTRSSCRVRTWRKGSLMPPTSCSGEKPPCSRPRRILHSSGTSCLHARSKGGGAEGSLAVAAQSSSGSSSISHWEHARGPTAAACGPPAPHLYLSTTAGSMWQMASMSVTPPSSTAWLLSCSSSAALSANSSTSSGFFFSTLRAGANRAPSRGRVSVFQKCAGSPCERT